MITGIYAALSPLYLVEQTGLDPWSRPAAAQPPKFISAKVLA